MVIGAVDQVPKVAASADGSYFSQFALGNKPIVPKLSSPEYSFTESFEAAMDTDRWISFHFAEWATDPTNAANRVHIAKYWPEGDQTDLGSPGNAWSELEFKLPISAVQVEMGFREFVPSSYTSLHANNHKSVGFHSGPYGITSSNLSVKSECWPRAGGATPSMYCGSDGTNRGHLMTTGSPLLWVNGDGAWHDIHVLLELANGEAGFGRYRVWRDWVLIIDNFAPEMEASWTGEPSEECIPFATRGNFVDICRVNGWCNKKEASANAFLTETHFLIDQFYIHANSAHGAITE